MGVKRGGGEGREKSAKGKKGRERRLIPFSPIPLPFPFLTTVSTPATQARTDTVRLQGLQNSKSNHFFTHRAVPYPDDTAFQR